MDSIGGPLAWVAFTGGVLVLLALDLGVFHRKAHEVHWREALIWSIVWVGLALAFNAGLWHLYGSEKGLEFLAGWLVEKSLSVDNVFVFLVIFSYFQVPQAYRHRVLFWGILGALITRAVFILAGAALLSRFEWVMYVFGLFLVVTGVRLFFERAGEVHPERNLAYRLFKRVFPATDSFRGSRLFVREDHRLLATPLFLVLVTVEATDIVFAIDSVPAVFAVTNDPFIVYTSNIFAILGLRALFFLLSGAIGKLRYLRPGLAGILAFVGLKMLVARWWHIPIGLSLGVIAGILAVAIAFSLARPAAKEPSRAEAPSDP